MADQTSPIQQIQSATNVATRLNENFDAASPAMLYGRDARTTTGLTWGYIGGRFGSALITSGTVTLDASATSYLVAAQADGAVSVSDTTTDWDDADNFLRLYKITTGASAVTAYEDHRQAIGGAGSGGGVDWSDITSKPSFGTAALLDVPLSGDAAAGEIVKGDDTRLSDPRTPEAHTQALNTLLQSGATTGQVPTWTGTVWAPATPGAGGMTNPMTTAGDVIVGGASGAPARLGVGATGDVLTVVSGSPAWAPAAGGGLTGFTATLNVASPNSSSNVSSLQASGGTASQDFSIMPKGSGSILAQIPDNGTGGGNKRGVNSVDLQRIRSSATQVAGGTSTFIGAGQNNKINGSLSYSSILNGNENLVSASFSTVVGGELGEATGANSFVGGGAYGKATGQYSFVGGGRINTASGDSSFIPGGRDAITRGVAGAFTHAAGRIENVGDAQTSVIVHSAITSNATLTNLTDKIVSGYMAMPDNSAFAFEATVVAKYGAIDFSAWTIKGLIKRGAGVATTAFVGTPTVSVIGATAGASAWAVSALASTGIGALILQVTGESGKSIKWVGRIVTVEVA